MSKSAQCRVGIDVVGDDLHPGLGDRVVVLLRRPLVRGDVLDPVADPGRGLRHAVAPYGHEGQVDVLPVPELPAGTGDPGQDPGQFGVSRAVRSGRGLMTGDWASDRGWSLIRGLEPHGGGAEPRDGALAGLLQSGDDGVVAGDLSGGQPGERLALQVPDRGEHPGGHRLARLGQRQPERAPVGGI